MPPTLYIITEFVRIGRIHLAGPSNFIRWISICFNLIEDICTMSTWLRWIIMVSFLAITVGSNHVIQKRAFYDSSILNYHSERTCWWNEVCKREFQSNFLCRCPRFAYCRSPGRYYNAYCSLTRTGYIWMQPLPDNNGR